MTGRTRAERKVAAFLRAQLSLKQALERVDYDFDVVAPKLAAMRHLEATNDVEVTAELEAADAEVEGLA
jgi:hypothetical protein